MTQRFRSFVFTSYEVAEPVIKEAAYYAYAQETCPSTGRLHWQGYCYYTNQRSLKSAIKLLKPWHVEGMRGSLSQSEAYCSKEGKLIEHGDKPKPGKRTDLEDVNECINMREVAEVATNINQIKFMEARFKYLERKRDWVPNVRWYWGPTGSGKTRLAVEEAGEDVWMSLNDGKWYEGYDGHENVIFDDVRGDFMKFHEWLRVLDRYEYRVEVKGSSRQFLAKNIWITTCSSPEVLWKNHTTENLAQLHRRITEIREFGKTDSEDDSEVC